VAIVNQRDDVAAAIQSAKEDLDRALVELDRMPKLDPAAVAFVAHAINNYMHVAEGVIDLLRFAMADHPDPDVLGWLDGLQHVSHMVHQTAARLLRAYEPGQIPLKFEEVRLDRLIERACAYHQGSASAKQVQIVCRYPTDLRQVWGDRVAIAVVADNLLSNAVKFSNPGGRVDVTLEASPGGVVCNVRDYGPGLTPLMQVRAFERGEVPGQPPPTSEHPSGYGLLVAKAFIDRLNGRLWSESEPGRGACFSFRIPYKPPEGEAERDLEAETDEETEAERDGETTAESQR
jgi:signal transduction histidine kinase